MSLLRYWHNLVVLKKKTAFDPNFILYLSQIAHFFYETPLSALFNFEYIQYLK